MPFRLAGGASLSVSTERNQRATRDAVPGLRALTGLRPFGHVGYAQPFEKGGRKLLLGSIESLCFSDLKPLLRLAPGDPLCYNGTKS